MSIPTLIDVIVGNYIPNTFGWLFLIVVLIVESLLLSIILNKALFNKKTTLAVVISNLATSLIGFIIFDQERNGGYLLSWIPINEYHGELRTHETVKLYFYCLALTLVFELIINYIILKKQHSLFKIALGTIIVNVVTYGIAALAFVYFANEFLKPEPLPYIYYQF